MSISVENIGAEKVVDSGTSENESDAVGEEEEPVEKTVCILITGLENINPSYSYTDLQVKSYYKELSLGETNKFPFTNGRLTTCSQEIHFKINPDNFEELNDMLNNPIYFTVYESMASLHYTEYPPPKQIGAEQEPKIWTSTSAIDLVEAVSGKTLDRTLFERLMPTPHQSLDSSSRIRRSNKSLKSKSSRFLSSSGVRNKNISSEKMKTPKSKSVTILYDYEPLIIGHCSLDLMFLFTGKRLVNKVLPIYQDEIYNDDRKVTDENLPRLQLRIFLPKCLFTPEIIHKSNIFYFTLESIFNIPSTLSPDLHYQVATMLPNNENLQMESLISGNFATERYCALRKKWPYLKEIKNFSALTKYRIDTDTTNVKNKFLGLDIANFITTDKPHIEWNVLNRKYLTTPLENKIKLYLEENRLWPIEFYFSQTKWNNRSFFDGRSASSIKKTISIANKTPKTNNSKQSIKKTNSTITPDSPISKETDFQNATLHYMGLADLSNLLQPGVKKTRVVCQLHTYLDKEALKMAGLENSYFVSPPPPPKQIVVELPVTKAKGKAKDKGSKSPKGKKGGKLSKVELDDDAKTNLNEYLPFKAKEPDTTTSQPLVDENGNPVFVLLEVELLRPLVPKEYLSDLTQDFYRITTDIPFKPKIVAIGDIANSCYKEIVNNLVKHMHEQFENFKNEAGDGKRVSGTEGQNNFVQYLNENGVYQTYLSTLFNAAVDLTRDKFAYNGSTDRDSDAYKEFIAQVYSYLVEEMNKVLYDVVICGLEQENRLNIDQELFFARKMMDMGADGLAQRYYLERIARDETNAQKWFEFGVHFLSIGENKMATQCMKEALVRDSEHKYALLTAGLLFANEEKWQEAEMCFLILLVFQSRFLEGWASLYLVYQSSNTKDSTWMNLCLEMCANCEKLPVEPDTVNGVDELAWTTEMAPRTIFFRTAMLLLKLRMLNYAEKALAMECHSGHLGVWHYYIGVILYLAQSYDHAKDHLHKAESIYGCNYAIGSLIGHCLMHVNKPQEAKEHYQKVLTLFDKPEDMHMLHVYLAIIYEGEENFIDAKKCLWHVCKISPTPYTWLTLGMIYFQQKDSLSAEECFIQSNLLDNRLAEPWAYLTILYTILGRFSEAKFCHRKTKRHGLKNAKLLQGMRECMQVFTQEN